MVGVTRFELVTSSVSGKRSPPELNALVFPLRWGPQREEYLNKNPLGRASPNLDFFEKGRGAGFRDSEPDAGAALYA